VEDAEFDEGGGFGDNNNAQSQTFGSKMNQGSNEGAAANGGEHLPEFPEEPGFNSDVPF
jgi:hypothetical protein